MQPRLVHFIVRPDAQDGTPGPIVPLVAVDQLPHWMQLSGVPRELEANQTIGLTNLGIVDKDDSVFAVRLRHSKIRDILNDPDENTDSHSSGGGKGKAKATKKKKTATHTETKSKSIRKNASEESVAASAGIPSSTEPGPVEMPAPRTQPAIRMLSASRHNTANTTLETKARSLSIEKPIRPHMTEATRDEPRPAAPKDTTTKPDKPPTIFCRHWCHTGTCKWGLACRYQHTMPTTPEGLDEVGLRDLPMWYLLFKVNAMRGGLGQGPDSPSQPLLQHHAPDTPSLDLRPVQDRLAALLGPGGAVSKRQKRKEISEMRHLLRGAAPAQQQQPRPHNNNGNSSGNYANLYTNASVAANAASIRRQAERQQQIRDDMPAGTRITAWGDVDDNSTRKNVAGRAGAGEVNLLDIY